MVAVLRKALITFKQLHTFKPGNCLIQSQSDLATAEQLQSCSWVPQLW